MEDTLRERLNITIEFFSCVLILVLMEDTLRDEKETRKSFGIFNVLILVLMEDTLRVWVITLLTEINMVLILVLMEDTLRAFRGGRMTTAKES